MWPQVAALEDSGGIACYFATERPPGQSFDEDGQGHYIDFGNVARQPLGRRFLRRPLPLRVYHVPQGFSYGRGWKDGVARYLSWVREHDTFRTCRVADGRTERRHSVVCCERAAMPPSRTTRAWTCGIEPVVVQPLWPRMMRKLDRVCFWLGRSRRVNFGPIRRTRLEHERLKVARATVKLVGSANHAHHLLSEYSCPRSGAMYSSRRRSDHSGDCDQDGRVVVAHRLPPISYPLYLVLE